MSRIQSLCLLAACMVSAVALAQAPAEKEKPAVERPAGEKPPGGELPPLPDPAPMPEEDLIRNQPGSRIKPAPEGSPSLLPGTEKLKPGERPRGRTTLKPPTTSADLDARIRFREAHSKAAQDPAIQAMWAESRTAKTDYEKREALRRYYTALYKRVIAYDKGLGPLVAERRQLALRKLDQTRIDPTDPLDEEHRQRRDY